MGKKKRNQPPTSAQAAAPARDTRSLLVYSVLFLTTLLVYAPVLRFDFVNFDDPDYVTRNAHVLRGITTDGVAWAFTSGEAANWFPVTRLSHMLDYQLFGLNGGLHHLTSVLFHALATLLLFAFLHRATGVSGGELRLDGAGVSGGELRLDGAGVSGGELRLDGAGVSGGELRLDGAGARAPSAFVAFLFALHPLHVESVAWIAERKDVLGAFFWFLALWGYACYAKKSSAGWFVFALSAFALGLMSKPMIVTLPFVLLLLDVWPLRRPLSKGILLEKAPFFALAGASAVFTYLVQQSSGAVRTADTFPIGLRIENALVSYVTYIVQMFWPSGLAVFYPYPSNVPAWKVLLSSALLVGVSLAVVRYFRACPYLAVGWCWYLGTLVPVIGLVQVGAQAHADRYTYVPAIGLGIMLAWGGADIVKRWPNAKTAVAGLAVAACLGSVVLCEAQIQYWQNSETLFRHAIDVTDGNYLAHHNLGVALAEAGRLPEAISDYRAALQIKPDSPRVLTDLGNALSQFPDRLPEAVAEYQAALRIDPNAAITHNDFGNTLSKIPGRLPEAIAEYETALRIQPDYADARNNLRMALSDSAELQYNMGVDLAKSGKPAEAIPHFEAALRLKPDYVDAHNNLGVVLAGSGRVTEAISHFEAALKIDPNSVDARANLSIALGTHNHERHEKHEK